VADIRRLSRARAGTTPDWPRFVRIWRALRRACSAKKETDMDWNRVEGNWKQLKGKIKEAWGELTDDDIERMAGNREQFEGKLQEKYGIGKDQVKAKVEEWLKTLH
jgi:uncharacterized protein YjbJ (UPF0337 family)